MIVQLTAERFKRLRAVTIRPDGSTVLITGKNAQGKSSVLDAIEAALGGKRHNPSEPIRRGEKDARVVVETEDYRVERVWRRDPETGKETTSLVVTDPGQTMRYGSPQALLDQLFADIGFDPLSFMRASGRQQGETLRRLLGLDFADLDHRRDQLFERRRDRKRDMAAVAGQIVGFADLPEDAPTVEVQTDDIHSGYDSANELERRRLTLKGAAAGYEREVGSLSERIALLEEQLGELVEQRVASQARRSAAQQQLSATPPPDLPPEGWMQRLQEANDQNEVARRASDRAGLRKRHDEMFSEVTGYTAALAEIETKKKDAIAGAKMPVPGLGFDEDGSVTYLDLPVDQASQSEKIRVSTAIGIKVNPGRLALSRDGSMLDAESLAEVDAIASAEGAQVWIEKATNGEPIGVVIHDGIVTGTGPWKDES